MNTRCGFVAVIGRPNVGKSTIMNTILGQKISITTFRPQTTRHQVLGIKTNEQQQIIFVDTPGMQRQTKSMLAKQMNKAARGALSDVDATIWVIEATKWTPEDEAVLKLVTKLTCPVIIAINKIDLLDNKESLLTLIEKVSGLLPNAEVIPLSARKKIQIEQLEQAAAKHLPLSPFYFEPNQITNKSERFRIAETIREKLMIQLDNELPYSLWVEVDSIEPKPNITHIHATIWAEREGHKKMIIGEKGQKLKSIGQEARLSLEKMLGQKVYLKLWVKCKAFMNDHQALKNLDILEY